MSLEQNKALVRRFVEEVQCQHNLAALDELFGPDFVDHSGMSSPPTLEGYARVLHHDVHCLPRYALCHSPADRRRRQGAHP